MSNKYNILHFFVDDKLIEVLPIGNKDPKQMVVELENAYEVVALEKQVVAYYYAPSKMNKDAE